MTPVTRLEPPRRLLSRAELASRLGHRVDWLNRHYPELALDGFPAPALGSRAGARWDPAAVDAWLDRKLPAPPAPAPDAALAQIGDELDRASERLAAAAAERKRA